MVKKMVKTRGPKLVVDKVTRFITEATGWATSNDLQEQVGAFEYEWAQKELRKEALKERTARLRKEKAEEMKRAKARREATLREKAASKEFVDLEVEKARNLAEYQRKELEERKSEAKVAQLRLSELERTRQQLSLELMRATEEATRSAHRAGVEQRRARDAEVSLELMLGEERLWTEEQKMKQREKEEKAAMEKRIRELEVQLGTQEQKAQKDAVWKSRADKAEREVKLARDWKTKADAKLKVDKDKIAEAERKERKLKKDSEDWTAVAAQATAQLRIEREKNKEKEEKMREEKESVERKMIAVVELARSKVADAKAGAMQKKSTCADPTFETVVADRAKQLCDIDRELQQQLAWHEQWGQQVQQEVEARRVSEQQELQALQKKHAEHIEYVLQKYGEDYSKDLRYLKAFDEDSAEEDDPWDGMWEWQ